MERNSCVSRWVETVEKYPSRQYQDTFEKYLLAICSRSYLVFLAFCQHDWSSVNFSARLPILRVNTT
ncbi:hypothetical protein AFLA_008880 [Aspergillus flavus NRRL3357]|nr:hypothetical protein AFLA_008880 [Aspergillus flavus NRRL3357]